MRIKFKTDNAAFEDVLLYQESARILRDIAEQVEMGAESGRIRDINGNHIGEWSF